MFLLLLLIDLTNPHGMLLALVLVLLKVDPDLLCLAQEVVELGYQEQAIDLSLVHGASLDLLQGTNR